MPRISYGSRKPPRLKIIKPSLWERIKNSRFARRVSHTKPVERRHKLYNEILDSIKQSKKKEEKIREIVSGIVDGKKTEFKPGKQIDAMFLFFRGIGLGLIKETEEVKRIKRQILEHSSNIAKELEKYNVSHPKKAEKSEYGLYYRLIKNMVEKKQAGELGISAFDVFKRLLDEKKKIEEQIREFIERETRLPEVP